MKTAPNSALKTIIIPVTLGLLLPISVLSAPGCKKDEPPPPLPSAAPAPTPAAPVELAPVVVEDAGPDVEDASDAAPVKKGVSPVAGLRRCCAALQQNAASAPPPTNVYMTQAAAACNAALASGQGASQAIGAISAALRGVGMPAACR